MTTPNITEHFTYHEMVKTDVKLDNVPDTQALVCLTHLCVRVLEPVRKLVNLPVRVTSGFRSKRVNAAVGGVTASQHLTGCAADISFGGPDTNKRIFQRIAQSDIPFDQLIDERNYRWIHISYRPEFLGVNRHSILHL